MKSDQNKCDYVDSQCPGFRVVAGPFYVDEDGPRWRLEQERCRKALKLLRLGGIERKLVMYGGEAFVLRTVKGWREAGNLSLPAGSEGLRCPVCSHGPCKDTRALGMHRCLRLPRVMVGDRELCGRLSEKQIEQAVEAAMRA